MAEPDLSELSERRLEELSVEAEEINDELTNAWMALNALSEWQTDMLSRKQQRRLTMMAEDIQEMQEDLPNDDRFIEELNSRYE